MEGKSNSNILITLLVIIIVLLLGVVGFLVYDKLNSKSTTPTNDEPLTPTNDGQVMTSTEALALGEAMYEKGIKVFSQSYNIEYGSDNTRCLNGALKANIVCTDEDACFEVSKECYDELNKDANNTLSGEALETFRKYVANKYITGNKILMKSCAKTCWSGDHSPIITVDTITENKIVYTVNTSGLDAYENLDSYPTSKNQKDAFVLQKDATKPNGWTISYMHYYGD